MNALGAGRPALQRAAAEALGRVGRVQAIPGLLAAAGARVDRVLEHSLIYAMIEIGDRAAIEAGLQAAASRTRRAALIALDQIDSGAVRPEGLIPLLDSPDLVLKDTAWWIAARHPEWGTHSPVTFRNASRLPGRLASKARICGKNSCSLPALPPSRRCSRRQRTGA